MSEQRMKIGILIGSNRPRQAGRGLADAIAEIVAERDDTEVEILDLREINLPWYDEPKPPAAGNYQHEHTKAWARTIDALDAVLIVTPQYNGGYPAALKNAIDSVFAEWKDKPLLLVSYGGPRSKGGQSSLHQLRRVFSIVPVRLLDSSTSMPIGPDDSGEPEAVLKDPTEVVGRHRQQLAEQIGELVAAAKEYRG